MKRFGVLLAVGAYCTLLCVNGCSRANMGDLVRSGLDGAAAPTPTATPRSEMKPQARPTPAPTAEAEYEEEAHDIIEKWDDRTQSYSSRFNGGGFAEVYTDFYMVGQGYTGLYRMNDYEQRAELVGDYPFGVQNMLFHDPYGWENGYLYYYAYQWDSDPGMLYRIRQGSTVSEEMGAAIAEKFVLLDGYIYYRNPYVPELYDGNERTKLYRAPADNLGAAELWYTFETEISDICDDGIDVFVVTAGEGGSVVYRLDGGVGRPQPAYTSEDYLNSAMVVGDTLFINQHAIAGDPEKQGYFAYNLTNGKLTHLRGVGALCANDLKAYMLRTTGRGSTLYESYVENLADTKTYTELCTLNAFIPKEYTLDYANIHQVGGTLYLYLFTHKNWEWNDVIILQYPIGGTPVDITEKLTA